MSKQHDENEDVRILSRKCYVNQGTKTIKASRSANIGIRSWGRIDFLTHYKGYHFIWEDVILDKSNNDDLDKKSEYRRIKKESKHIKNSRIMNS